jgi:predicted ATP-grasp superfamily ATP-dependent carboligase
VRFSAIDSEKNSRISTRPCVQPAVLILGWIPRIILPIARSLHRRGVSIDVASFPGAPRIRSRAICQQRSVAEPQGNGAEFVKQIRAFITDRGHEVLIPTDDCMLTAIVEHYHELANLLHIACPPPEITRLVLDKTATLKIAQNCGLQIPKTEVVSNSSQLHNLIGRFPFPWVLKPAEKETRMEEVKSCTLTTANEVHTTFPPGREFAPPMLVQQYCSGTGVGVEILLHQGECIAAFQHRRLKELPYSGGVSVTAVAERVDDALLALSLALLRTLQWDGLAMVEYRVDSTGRAVLMEVNGRYWGTIALPIFAGIDFPLYHWRLVHGQHVDAPKTYAAGIKWRWTIGYLDRLYILCAKARHSSIARRALGESLRNLFADFSLSVRDATFEFSDPMASLIPFLRALWYFVSHTAARAWRRPALSRQSRGKSGLSPSKP